MRSWKVPEKLLFLHEPTDTAPWHMLVMKVDGQEVWRLTFVRAVFLHSCIDLKDGQGRLVASCWKIPKDRGVGYEYSVLPSDASELWWIPQTEGDGAELWSVLKALDKNLEDDE